MSEQLEPQRVSVAPPSGQGKAPQFGRSDALLMCHGPRPTRKRLCFNATQISEEFNVAIVVTNQVMSDPGG